MDLPARLSGWLDPHRRSQGGRARPHPAEADSLMRLTVSFGRRTLNLAIGRSAKARLAPHMPSPAEEILRPDDGIHTAQSLPPQTPEEPSAPPAKFYSLPQQRQTVPPVSRQQNPADSFWDALDPTEREALRSVASWRTFAAGATIMEEGERADHVMVILGGRVKVCVNDNGSERVLAERGLGQLVGEQGALRVSVRSATVIALDMIWALVVQTKDFAAFLSVHPRALDIVQRQLHQRSTDESASHGSGHSRAGMADGMTAVEQLDHDRIAWPSRRRPQPLTGENCTVFLTDVVGFGARTRTDSDRLLIREALFRMTQAAMQPIPDARSEDRGDGFLTVVPPAVSTARVIGLVLKAFPAALQQHNSSQRESARFKLRLALNVGPVVSDMGVSGEAIIVAARLLEAPQFKEAIRKSTASLGVIASPFVYETAIRHSTDPLDVASYTEVPVEVKESHTTAWMKLFNASILFPLTQDPIITKPHLDLLTRFIRSRDIGTRAGVPPGSGFPEGELAGGFASELGGGGGGAAGTAGRSLNLVSGRSRIGDSAGGGGEPDQLAS
jgi:CRP-like cAMP-binding protein